MEYLFFRDASSSDVPYRHAFGADFSLGMAGTVKSPHRIEKTSTGDAPRELVHAKKRRFERCFVNRGGSSYAALCSLVPSKGTAR